MGHTEDALDVTLNRFYFVSAHIISDKPQGKWGVTEEKFTSLCYAGHLPGYTMNYNHHGLVFSINTLTAKHLRSGKTRKCKKSKNKSHNLNSVIISPEHNFKLLPIIDGIFLGESIVLFFINIQ